eukprot:TRINITY_DN3492_c0_g1_i1.p1 TRINITY_DN3492_c0_g1~~TRINITY_DN3492_c0_g1_i1.p1  ORF type:complete len:154 (-),score=17.69 TRINITY_DN3492_c0_g1_i1:325-786(-)
MIAFLCFLLYFDQVSTFPCSILCTGEIPNIRATEVDNCLACNASDICGSSGEAICDMSGETVNWDGVYQILFEECEADKCCCLEAESIITIGKINSTQYSFQYTGKYYGTCESVVNEDFSLLTSDTEVFFFHQFFFFTHIDRLLYYHSTTSSF